MDDLEKVSEEIRKLLDDFEENKKYIIAIYDQREDIMDRKFHQLIEDLLSDIRRIVG